MAYIYIGFTLIQLLRDQAEVQLSHEAVLIHGGHNVHVAHPCHPWLGLSCWHL